MALLSAEQKEQFIHDGYLVIEDAFLINEGSLPKSWVDGIWKRYGIDPDNPDGWPQKIHMPSTEQIPLTELNQQSYDIIAEIVGGANRFSHPLFWHNGFIANFAFGIDQEWKAPSPESEGWHADGDFFLHFLDSPEQGILIGSYYTDIEHKGGGTFISPGSHKVVARFLAEHPEGVMPNFVGTNDLIHQCDRFLEYTAKAGSMVIMHPFMLHASSYNHNKKVRLMNNNNAPFKEPMCFKRADGSYNLVEQAILTALDVAELDFKITSERQRIFPERIKRQEQLRKEEEARLAVNKQ